MEFKQRLKQLRDEKQLTQEGLAEKIKVARSNISKYESGQLDISSDILKKMAYFFSVSTDYLLGITDEPQNGNILDAKFNQLQNLQNKHGKLVDLKNRYDSIQSQKEDLINFIKNTEEDLVKEYWELIRLLDIKEIKVVKDFKERGLSLEDVVEDLKRIAEKYK